jgi:hypothetical protein
MGVGAGGAGEDGQVAGATTAGVPFSVFLERRGVVGALLGVVSLLAVVAGALGLFGDIGGVRATVGIGGSIGLVAGGCALMSGVDYVRLRRKHLSRREAVALIIEAHLHAAMINQLGTGGAAYAKDLRVSHAPPGPESESEQPAAVDGGG